MPALFSLIAAWLAAISQLIPLFPDSRLLSRLFLGQELALSLQFAIFSGIALAGLIFFRHDWAAMVSGFLQVVLLRRKPLSLDERYPFLLAISVGGAIGLAILIHRLEGVSGFLSNHSALAMGLGLILGAGALAYFDSIGKTLKTMTGWTIWDALLCGVLGGLALVLDGTLAVGILIAARIRSYYRDASTKFLSLCAITWCFVEVSRLKSGETWDALLPGDPTPLVPWLLSFAIAFGTTWLILGSYARRTESNAFKRIATFRALAGLALVVWALVGPR